VKFSQEDTTDVHSIKSYDTSSIVIQSADKSGLTTLKTPFILSTDQLITVWPINNILDFNSDDVKYFKVLDIEVLIIGQLIVTRLTGPTLVKFSEQGIGIEQMPIGAACRTYNLLISEGRRVALVINFD
tara:strand:- start:179 stop:565 length:387 start_codon:yes stop_codon:yes gene_type:complete